MPNAGKGMREGGNEGVREIIVRDGKWSKVFFGMIFFVVLLAYVKKVEVFLVYVKKSWGFACICKKS